MPKILKWLAIGVFIFVIGFSLFTAYVKVKSDAYKKSQEDTCVVTTPEPPTKSGYANINVDGTWLQLDRSKFAIRERDLATERGCVDRLQASFLPNILSDQELNANRYIPIEFSKKGSFTANANTIKKLYFVSSTQNWQDIGLTLYQRSKAPNTSLAFTGELTGEPFSLPYPYEVGFHTRHLRSPDGDPKIYLYLTSQPIHDGLFMRIRITDKQIHQWKNIFTEIFSTLKE